MNEAQWISRLALCTQLGTAVYALRLNRLVGTERAGWALFGAFGLMVVLHLTRAWESASSLVSTELNPEFVHLVASMLLLIGLVHVGVLFRERIQAEELIRENEQELADRMDRESSEWRRRVENLEEQLQLWHRQALPAPAGASIATPILPRTTAQGSAGTRQPINLVGGRARQKTVLLAEDEPAIRELVAEILTREGLRVLEADSGAAALSLWAQNAGDIDLLLTDVVMPGGLDGWALAEQLKQSEPQLKVICTSGYAPDLTSCGIADHFLPKPYEIARLRELVREALCGV